MRSRRRRSRRPFQERFAWSNFRDVQVSRRIKAFSIPTLLALFVIFGGANGEGLGVHALFLMLSGFICAAAILDFPVREAPRDFRWLSGFLGAVLVIGIFQLIELPTGIWRLFGARAAIEQGWDLIQVTPGFESISAAPLRTIIALSYGLIPAAFLLGVYRLGWRATVANLPWTIAVLGAASAGLGLMQVLLPSVPELYLYVYTNPNTPAGFFANINQQAIFLLMCMPFTTVVISKLLSKRERTDQQSALMIFAGLLGAMQLIGVLAAGSVAGYLILVPILALCYLISQSQRRRINLLPAFIGLVVLFPAILLVAYSPQLSGLGVTSIANDGPMSRVALAGVGSQIFFDHWFFGTGLGTFEPMFKMYEDPDLVTLKYANHVHNDYLQWAIETGVIGLVVLFVFLRWLGARLLDVWRMYADSTTRLRRAAATAALAPLLHSFVEYPVRAPALLAFASLCVVLLVVPYNATRSQKTSEGDGSDANEENTKQLTL